MTEATEVVVEIAKGHRVGESFAAMAWTDISVEVQAGTVNRGRSTELGDFPAGKFHTRLRNPHRDFDPTFSTGPHWPHLLPLIPTRCRAVRGGIGGDAYNAGAYGTAVYGGEGTSHPLFTGFALGWPQDYQPPMYSTVDLDCADAFEVLAQTELPESVWAKEIADLTGLRSWWRLGESQGTVAVDSGPKAHHGIYQRGATFNSRSSLVGYSSDASIEFNGDGQAVGVPAATVVGAVPFYVGGLISTETPVGMIFDQEYDRSAYAPTGRFRVSFATTADGKVRFDAESGTLGRVESTTAVTDGQPHLVVAVMNSPTSASIFVDGVDRTTVVTPFAVGARLPVGFNTAIGRTFDGYQYFAGTVDEVFAGHGGMSAATAALLWAAATRPWAGDTSGGRVAKILDLAGWSAADRDLDVGESILGPTPLGTDALSAIRSVESAESGRVWVDPTGKVVFKSRHAVYTDPASTVVQSTWGDGGGAELPWFRDGFRFDYDRDTVFNQITGQRVGGAEVTVTDPVSIGKYRTRPRDLPPVAVRDDTELRSLLEYHLDRYNDPQLRLGSVTVKPASRPRQGVDTWTADELWDAALGMEVSDRQAVYRRPQGLGTITFVGITEGVEHRWGKHAASSWETTFSMSPAGVRSYWVLGTSVLGTATRLSY